MLSLGSKQYDLCVYNIFNYICYNIHISSHNSQQHVIHPSHFCSYINKEVNTQVYLTNSIHMYERRNEWNILLLNTEIDSSIYDIWAWEAYKKILDYFLDFPLSSIQR
jgi:hypothetical protein